jgi:uncharacterized protein YdeI (YjbR/CyaY-like superfamily)
MLNTLYVTTRDEWRAWLTTHYASETEIWLIYYKKHSTNPRIPYDYAVEEALCFGWIDSTVRRIDEDCYAQKFTPRRDRTNWSPSNEQRIKRLIQGGRMTQAGLAKIDPTLLNKKAAAKPPQKNGVPTLPPFIKKALMANPKAWQYFRTLAPSYRRLYLKWILSAKQDETRNRRLKEAVLLLKQNKKLGLK